MPRSKKFKHPADSLRNIRNIGEKMEAALIKAGISTASALEAIGADEAYLQILKTDGQRGHLLMYQALLMGLEGRKWNAPKGAEKTAIKARHEAIKSKLLSCPQTQDMLALNALDAELQLIGVIKTS